MEISDLKNELIFDEGLQLKPYRDSVGKLTIGVGRNLDDMGITANEAHLLLENDIERAMADLDHNVTWWRHLPDTVQRGMVNMVFNLGWPRFSGFRKMLRALEARDFEEAAREALDSKWAEQVGARAERISKLFRSAAHDTV